MNAKNKLSRKALEKTIHQMGFRIIQEKGNFQSGYCIVMDKKVIVINKYLDDKNKYQILRDIFEEINEKHPPDPAISEDVPS